jgi:hypothetical protein
MACYICLDEHPPLLAHVCGCKSSVVHADCLAQWVEQSQSSQCTVCREQYRGVCVLYDDGSSSHVRAAVKVALFALVGAPLFLVLLVLVDQIWTVCVSCALFSAFLFFYEFALAVLLVGRVLEAGRRPLRRYDVLRDVEAA